VLSPDGESVHRFGLDLRRLARPEALPATPPSALPPPATSEPGGDDR
jgi:hypothetical protein